MPVTAPRRVVDLGCGPGNSTELLAERFPDAEIVGVDTSETMLASARGRLPAVRFLAGDAATWRPPQPVDVIFANALFQWVPDHLSVLADLMGSLVPGGVLAVQMPDNMGEPSHVLMRETARDAAWARRFATPVARDAIPAPAAYYDRLRPLARRVDVWHTVYNHPLAGPPAIVEWVKGTGLRPFLDRLSADEVDPFLAAYERRIAAAYPPLADGKVLFRFPRLFVVASKAA